MRTDELIELLASDLTPVRPLPPPWLRTLLWLGIAAAGLIGVVLVMAPRPELAERLRETRFLIELSAIAVTAILAAMAAFAISIPGSHGSLMLLPLPGALVWLASLGDGCRQAWVADGGFGPHFALDWGCIPIMLLAMTSPALAMLAMLRRSAQVAPARSAILGALAATALGSFALKLLHVHDTSILVLTWLVASIAITASFARVLARLALTAHRLTPT